MMFRPPAGRAILAGRRGFDRWQGSSPEPWHKLFIATAAPTARSLQPGIEATPRDTERPAQPIRRPDSPMLRNEPELHVDSFAKYAAAFFRMSRSVFSLITSRL